MKAKTRLHYPLRLGSRMLPTDAFFWYAEAATPQLRPLVAALFMLDRVPERQRFRAAVKRLIARVPRFQQRVVESPLRFGLPRWEDDPGFDLDYHVRELILPEPASDRHLFDFASAVFAAPLDHLRPLWEAYLIEGLEGGRAAYFLKLHHAVMDGLGSVALFDALTQARRNDAVRAPRHVPARGPLGSGAVRVATAGPARLWQAVAGIGGAARAGARALLDPGNAAEEMVRAARGVRGMIRDFNAPVIHDPLATRCIGIGRRLDGLSVSMARMRRLKEALGVTLNDLILTVVSGAVGRYHDHRGIYLKEVHCMVPMSLRRQHERYVLGNRLTAFTVRLPVGEGDPLVRLERIRRQTSMAKGDGQGAIYRVVMQAAAMIPATAFRVLTQAALGRVHLICSNMPGPPVRRYLAGAKIDTVYPFAPIMRGTPLSVALLSYGDSYAVGIDTDPAAIPDAERVRQFVQEEIAAVERAALPPEVRSEPTTGAREPRRLRLVKKDGPPARQRPGSAATGPAPSVRASP